MSLSMLVGGYAAQSTIAIVIAAALWGYAYGLISSLGPAATAVGLNSVVALIVADAFSGSSMAGVPLQALLVLAGGLEQTLLLVILWPTRRYSAERHALGDAYRALGAFAHDIAGSGLAAPHPSIIASAGETLSDPAPFARRGDIAVFQALLDEAERARAGLAALVTDRYRYDRREETERAAKVRESGAALAPLFEEIADALHEARGPKPMEQEWQRVEAAAAQLDTLPGVIGLHARSQAQALLGQLRTAWRLASMPAAEQPATGTIRRRALIPPLEQTWIALRANLAFDSLFGRHAMRLALALGIAMLVARIGPIHRGYWIPMTAALVLRPDFHTTFTRGFARVAGTLLGAIVATAIVAFAHPSPHLDVALAIFFAALGYFVFGLNYAAYSATVTAYVVFLLVLSGNVPEHDAVLDRALATLAGAALAGLVYLSLPTWESQRVRGVLAAHLSTYRRYAAAILGGYIDPATFDRKRVRELQRTGWQARTKAEATVDAMIAEPEHLHAIPRRVALGVLAAQQRIGVALLALNAYLDGAQRIARPELQPLADGFDRAWRRLVALLRQTEAPPPMPPLRDLYRESDARSRERQDPDAGVIFAECDLIVDGLNTMNDLLAPQKESAQA